MIRVFDFRMEGSEEIVKLASMSHVMAKAFVKEGEQLLANETTPLEKWQGRQADTITVSMQRAGTENPDLSQFDIPTLNAMFTFILEKSGLKTGEPKSGEVKAA